MVNFLDAVDSVLSSLKSTKTKHPAAPSSSVTPTEVSTPRPVQASLLPASPGPAPPAPAPHSPDHTELPSADSNHPQAADLKAQLIRKEAAESEVIRFLSSFLQPPGECLVALPAAGGGGGGGGRGCPSRVWVC